MSGVGFAKVDNFVHELTCYDIGCCAFSEHRWSGSGQFSHDGWTFVFCGHAEGGKHGVGFAMNREWTKQWTAFGSDVEFVSPRLLRIR